MLSQYAPTVKAVIVFLKQLNVRVNKKTINDTLQNHPDWPSLLTISDTLRQWNILNAAGKIDPASVRELPVPFMTYSNYAHNSIEIVTSVTDNTVEVITHLNNKPVSKSIETFIQEWDGAYLIAETNETSGEPDYPTKRLKYFLQKTVLITTILSLSILLFLKFQQNLQGLAPASQTFLYTQFVLMIVGVGVTFLLLWHEIDKNNPFLKKICTGIKKGNCNAILSSNGSKVFSWLSWSETGFFYFAGCLLLLSLSDQKAHLVQLSGWFNLLVLPYTIYSIYYQWKVAKEWCVLCLSVQAIILGGGVNTFFYLFPVTIPDLPFDFLLSTILLYILPVSAWFTLKPWISKLQEHSITKRDYLRIKYNNQIFYSLLSKQKQITGDPSGLGIDVGKPEAMHTLIKVCNPYCGPCADAHPHLDQILSEVKQLKLKIIFIAPNNPENFSFKIVRHMMAIAEEYDPAHTKQALDSWYLGSEKEYEKFAEKFPVKQDLKQPGSKIENMFNWCTQNNVKYTPTYFLNGHQLPDTYNIADLQYFLLD